MFPSKNGDEIPFYWSKSFIWKLLWHQITLSSNLVVLQFSSIKWMIYSFPCIYIDVMHLFISWDFMMPNSWELNTENYQAWLYNSKTLRQTLIIKVKYSLQLSCTDLKFFLYIVQRTVSTICIESKPSFFRKSRLVSI